MSYANITKDYINSIKKALEKCTTLEDLKQKDKLLPIKIDGVKDFYFISYSHEDFKLVYNDLCDMYLYLLNQHNDELPFYFWYDEGKEHGVNPGDNWEKVVESLSKKFAFKGILYYVSENFIRSESILKEINILKETGIPFIPIILPSQAFLAMESAGDLTEKQKGKMKYIKDNKYGYLELLKKALPDAFEPSGKWEILSDSIINIKFEKTLEALDNRIKEIKRLPKKPLFEIENGIITKINDINIEEINQIDYRFKNNETPDEIGKCVFANCRFLEKVFLPESIDSIEEYAFYGCSSLKEIDLSNVQYIKKAAFSECSSLLSIEIPEGVKQIGYEAFNTCYRLVEIYNLSSNIEIKKESSENGCIGLYAKVIHTSLEEKSSLVEKDNCVFIKDNENKYYLVSYNGESTKLVLPKSIEENKYEINDCAFYNYSNLVSIKIPEGVESIGYGAFCNCSSLKSIEIPKGVTSIGHGAFCNCSSLESIEIPKGVTSIGHGAFCNCSSLESIEIPKGVTSIGESFFSGCSSLESIEIPERVENIGEIAFYNCSSLQSIKIPKGVESIGNSTFFGCSSLVSIEIPEGVTSIGEFAFYYCSSLQSIKIPKGVENINNSAFSNCSSLVSIEIPDGVESIGEFAFSECSSLSIVKISIGVTSIGDYAFFFCKELKEILYNGTKLQWGSIQKNDLGIKCKIICSDGIINEE